MSIFLPFPPLFLSFLTSELLFIASPVLSRVHCSSLITSCSPRAHLMLTVCFTISYSPRANFATLVLTLCIPWYDFLTFVPFVATCLIFSFLFLSLCRPYHHSYLITVFPLCSPVSRRVPPRRFILFSLAKRMLTMRECDEERSN